jgi:hypothetical protein
MQTPRRTEFLERREMQRAMRGGFISPRAAGISGPPNSFDTQRGDMTASHRPDPVLGSSMSNQRVSFNPRDLAQTQYDAGIGPDAIGQVRRDHIDRPRGSGHGAPSPEQPTKPGPPFAPMMRRPL